MLCTETAKKYEAADNVILIHDPSEIRKKYTKQAEHIGKVKDLSKKTINGYSSFNTIAVNLDNKQIDLLSHELYSNKQPEFLSKETIEQLSAGEDIVISQESKEAYDDDSYLTSKRVALKHIKSCSNALKEKNSTLNIVLQKSFVPKAC